MVPVYVFASIFAGLIAAFASIYAGAGFWRASLMYVAGGTAMMVTLPVVTVLTRALVTRFKSVEEEVEADAELTQKAATPEPDEATTPTAQETPRPMRILAVDDDPFILEVVPKIAANTGFPDVTVADSAQAALALIESSKTGFDCLLLDIKMPGMDGIELCRQVRTLDAYRDRPIIMLTAMRDIESMTEAFEAGATDYAKKPFEIEDLSERLRSAQEAVHAQGSVDSGPAYVAEPGRGLLERKLISSNAMAHFISELPATALETTKLYAIRIDDIDTVIPQLPAPQMSELLQSFAAETVRLAADKLSFISFDNDMNLLLATEESMSEMPDEIEAALEAHISSLGIAVSGGEAGQMVLDVSVGGPIGTQGSKAHRANAMIDRAVGAARARVWEKSARRVVGLPNG